MYLRATPTRAFHCSAAESTLQRLPEFHRRHLGEEKNSDYIVLARAKELKGLFGNESYIGRQRRRCSGISNPEPTIPLNSKGEDQVSVSHPNLSSNHDPTACVPCHRIPLEHIYLRTQVKRREGWKRKRNSILYNIHGRRKTKRERERSKV